MYFLAINKIKQNADRTAIGNVIPRHIQWSKQMIAEGKLAQAGKWGDTGGIAIIRAKDPAEAENILSKDPLVSSGFVSVEMARFYPDVEIEISK